MHSALTRVTNAQTNPAIADGLNDHPHGTAAPVNGGAVPAKAQGKVID